MFGLTRPFSKRTHEESDASSEPVEAAAGAAGPDDHWLLFVALFPPADPTGRMKVLKTVETLGCGMLREGVYLLPESAEHLAQFDRLAEYVTSIGGTAHILHAANGGAMQNDLFRTLFDRSDAYRELAKTIESLKAGFGVSTAASIAHVLERQREAFTRIAAIDFFESDAKGDCARLLAETERAVGTMLIPDAGKLAARAAMRKQFFEKTWATRAPLTSDRLACAWFIRRYVDSDAPLEWSPTTEGSITFGFEGARFAPTPSRTAFEEMLAFFQLQKNVPLVRLAAIVHAIAAGQVILPEAVELEGQLAEARTRHADDAAYTDAANGLFDALVERFRLAALQKARP